MTDDVYGGGDGMSGGMYVIYPSTPEVSLCSYIGELPSDPDGYVGTQ